VFCHGDSRKRALATSAEFHTFAVHLGPDARLSGKLKQEGVDLWTGQRSEDLLHNEERYDNTHA
jgi:hypothetical protein